MIFSDILKASIPEGANYHGAIVLEGNPDVTMIEYDVDGKIGRMHFNKLDIVEKFTRPIIIPFKEGMTANDVYQHITDKFNLGFVKGVDFPDDTTEIAPTSLFQTFPIASTSYGYKGYFQVLISSGKNNLIKDGKLRDIRLADVGVTLLETKIRQRLCWTVFEGEGKLFSGYMISFLFRKMIAEKLEGFDQEDIDDVIYGFIEYAFNDGLSDIIMVRTPNARLYPIRFNAQLGDYPVTR